MVVFQFSHNTANAVVMTTGFLVQACLPDVYRGKYRDKDTAGPLYADEVKQILDTQKERGKDVAAFIHESMLSCAGQIIPPKGYFTEVYRQDNCLVGC